MGLATLRYASHRPASHRFATFLSLEKNMRMSFEQSAETRELVRFFGEVSVGSPVSWTSASKSVGFKVHAQLAAYHSARRIVQRDSGIVISTIRKFGFQRLAADQICDSGEAGLSSIRRRARREAGKQEIAIAGNLDQRHMLRSTELLSRFRIIGDNARPGKTNRPMIETPEIETELDPRVKLRTVA